MRRVPHRFIEGCLIAAHAIQAEAVFIYIRGEYLAEYLVLEAAAEGGSPASSAMSTSSSTEARAPTSAARSRRSWSRSRAAGASPARGRRSRRWPASTCSRR